MAAAAAGSDHPRRTGRAVSCALSAAAAAHYRLITLGWIRLRLATIIASTTTTATGMAVAFFLKKKFRLPTWRPNLACAVGLAYHHGRCVLEHFSAAASKESRWI